MYKNKEYNIKEAVAYYILAYRRYSKKNHKKGLEDVLKYVLEEAKENINMHKIEGVNNDLLKRISFNWNLTSDDLLAYATCIFYVLMNRKEKITEEKIVKVAIPILGKLCYTKCCLKRELNDKR